MMKKEEGSWEQYDEKRRRIMGSSAMKKRRRTYRHGKGDCIMYGFTIALCIFTVFVLLSGGKKSGQGGTEAAGEAAAGSGTQTAGNGGGNQAADADGAQTPDEVRGQKSEEDAVSEQPWNREQGSDVKTGNDKSVGNETDTGQDSGSGTGSGTGTGAKGGAGQDTNGGKPEITLVMAGDILLHTPVADSGKREDGSYDFSAVFAEMKEEIASADLALVNQEVILGGEELGISGYPAFNAPYELGDALAEAGFDVVLHATNHALDKGTREIVNCLAFWQEQYPDMAVLGIHESLESQEEIYVYEQDGIRLAILNYTYGTNGIALPQDMPYAVDLLDRDRVAADLQRAQELADFVIVCPHWGTEYVLEATAEQEEWAVFFAENGADLILGTHPHVIEPVDWVAGEEGGTLVYYSLGNFVNWTSGTGEGVANRMVGGMAHVTVGLDEAGEAAITAYGVEPLVCHVEQGYGGVTVYPLDQYTEELAKRNEIVSQDSHFSLAYCRNLVEKVFGNLWIP